MSDRIYGRKCRLIIGTGEDNGIDVSELRWTFKIVKTMTDDPNKSEVIVYNIENFNSDIKEGAVMILEAGYEENRYGAIFTGHVRQPMFGFEDDNVTSFVKLIGLDSAEFMNKSVVNQTLAAGATHNDVVATAINNGTKTIEQGIISDELSSVKLSRGKVMFGQPKKYLNQVATGDLVFYTNDNEVNIIKPTDIPSDEAVELTPSTGLIGRPVQTDEGISGRTLLHPSININTMIHIDGGYVNKIEQGEATKPLPGSGVYKIISLTHIGDSRANDWYTEFEAIAQPNRGIAGIPQEG